jgi:glucuronate isomerase
LAISYNLTNIIFNKNSYIIKVMHKEYIKEENIAKDDDREKFLFYIDDNSTHI